MEDKITAAATRWKAGSWSTEEGEELPADCIGWQDEDVVSMSGRRRLPQLLPPELMKLKTGRQMQGHLASLADVAHQREMVTFLARLFSSAASQALGSGGLSSGGALEAAAMSVLDSGMQGCLRAPSELAPNQQAVWLLQSTASGAAAADEAAKFLPNTLHELVTAWHKVRHLIIGYFPFPATPTMAIPASHLTPSRSKQRRVKDKSSKHILLRPISCHDAGSVGSCSDRSYGSSRRTFSSCWLLWRWDAPCECLPGKAEPSAACPHTSACCGSCSTGAL